MPARAKTSGGATHARYGHTASPTSLAVVCPACGAEAQASLPSHAAGVFVTSDLSPEHHEAAWRLACLRCPHRAGPFTYEAMRAQLPLYFDERPRGHDLWAWNREHLEMLLAIFSGDDVSDHRYGWLATYVPGAWKRRRAQYQKLARRLLER